MPPPHRHICPRTVRRARSCSARPPPPSVTRFLVGGAYVVDAAALQLSPRNSTGHCAAIRSMDPYRLVLPTKKTPLFFRVAVVVDQDLARVSPNALSMFLEYYIPSSLL
eukprot:GO256079.1.p2 GENE.GO256079.1~~GO256079.1.p2  ORF type:complete len:109 (+),score=8.59 GO256079.1:173-499(+)